MDERSKRRPTARRLAIAASATILVALIVAWTHTRSPDFEPKQVVIPATPVGTDVAILSAAIEPVIYLKRKVWFLRFESEYLISYLVSMRNNSSVNLTECLTESRFSNEFGQKLAAIFSGKWINWYNGIGAAWEFDLASGQDLTRTFFSVPDPDKFWPLDALDVRILCKKPSFQISPWYNVDLRHIEWRDITSQ